MSVERSSRILRAKTISFAREATQRRHTIFRTQRVSGLTRSNKK